MTDGCPTLLRVKLPYIGILSRKNRRKDPSDLLPRISQLQGWNFEHGKCSGWRSSRVPEPLVDMKVRMWKFRSLYHSSDLRMVLRNYLSLLSVRVVLQDISFFDLVWSWVLKVGHIWDRYNPQSRRKVSRLLTTQRVFFLLIKSFLYRLPRSTVLISLWVFFLYGNKTFLAKERPDHLLILTSIEDFFLSLTTETGFFASFHNQDTTGYINSIQIWLIWACVNLKGVVSDAENAIWGWSKSTDE